MISLPIIASTTTGMLKFTPLSLRKIQNVNMVPRGKIMTWLRIIVTLMYLFIVDIDRTNGLVGQSTFNRIRRRVTSNNYDSFRPIENPRIRHLSPKTLIGSPYETKSQESFITSTSVKHGRHKTPSILVSQSGKR